MKNANKKYTLDANYTLDQAIDTLDLLVEHGIEESCGNDMLSNGVLIETALGGNYRLDTSLLTHENLMNDGRVKLIIDGLLNHIIGAYQVAETDQE